ncbi:HAD superfamily hydrolase (TIGR01509 family) [Friedmanniella endophytica]|uniref:HAD superfamily hydrolase (TIGR01509 family) n=1 Tax=Microlunatus kandeliicorticis TaxID=1759536 RepID=A0A7W3ITP4_9ACTN|nr:HAD family phosphatase [Microlunatus kandeliicorticis]MBA8795068.1 HAD superfamily hydrolase (TIGR01509 family) [Microlunatus kandeliicorticis]
MTTDSASSAATPTTLPTTTPTATSRPAAALWDFDGTLVDTEPIWIAAEYDLIGGLGGEWNDEHAHQLVGNSLLESGAYIANAIGRPDLEPAWIVDQLITQVVDHIRTHPIPWRPGALELLSALREAGIRCALVSASYRVLLDAAIARLPEGTFEVSVAGDEVTEGKPHPEPYVTAARLLDVDPRACVVFEDSPPGAQSGNAAGAMVVGIEHIVPLPRAPRRVVVDTLAGMDVPALLGLVERLAADTDA